MFLKVFMIIIILIVFMYMLFYLISYKLNFNMESSSGYECGFNFISNARMIFSYRFFLIGILFLIFDVEIVLLLLIPFLKMNLISMMVIILFFLILILGFLYEFYCGSLEWV